MSKAKSVFVREILDSRGNPTAEADIRLEDGTFAVAAVSSEAFKGINEACELRDKEEPRIAATYAGRGAFVR